MQQLRSTTLDRRNFLRGAVLLGSSLVVGDSSGKAPEKLESIVEIPEYQVSIRDWTPIDVTDKIWSMMTRLRPGKSGIPSQNRNWWISGHIEYSTGGTDPMERFLGKGHTPYCLFDDHNGKVFILADGDEKLVGFPNASFRVSLSAKGRIADNGATIYDVNWPLRTYEPGKILRGDEGTEALIIADIKNRKKIIIKEKSPFSRTTMHMSDISLKGNRGVIQAQNRFYVFDIPSGNIVYTSQDGSLRKREILDPIFEAMNGDGSVIAFNDCGIYSRLDLRNNELTKLWNQERTHNAFLLSPNGNFLTCKVESSGDSRVLFYVHSTKEKYAIVVPSRDRDEPISVADDGTLKAYSGTYKYQEGDLFWNGNDPPNGLRFFKH